jgi:signal recognition particle subunit SRP54
VFVGWGLEIKRWSPATWTMVAELANDWFGYIPTSDQALRGAYGAKPILSRRLEADGGRKMTDAVQVAMTFHERIGVSGVVLTKLDGDARGGAALSIRAAAGVPVKYVGVGEKSHQLEPFHPDRMAARILGMGDVLTLVEQAEEAIDERKAERLAARMAKNRFTLQDFLEQLEEMTKMGPLSQVLEKIPGMRKAPIDAAAGDRDLPQALAILRSMTVEERQNPSIIGGSRKKRIALGSGTRVRDVNRLLSQFEQARRVFRQLGGRKRGGKPPFDLLGV